LVDVGLVDTEHVARRPRDKDGRSAVRVSVWARAACAARRRARATRSPRYSACAPPRGRRSGDLRPPEPARRGPAPAPAAPGAVQRCAEHGRLETEAPMLTLPESGLALAFQSSAWPARRPGGPDKVRRNAEFSVGLLSPRCCRWLCRQRWYRP